jgi:hypothetical protein
VIGAVFDSLHISSGLTFAADDCYSGSPVKKKNVLTGDVGNAKLFLAHGNPRETSTDTLWS